MISAKQLADFGYKTFSSTMIIFTGFGVCFIGYQGFKMMLASDIRKHQQQNSSNSPSP